jgi:DNA-binding NarL/FixJ family response regulator
MQCLIVDNQMRRLENSQIAFIEAGMQVTGSGSGRVTEACLRRSIVDVLVIDHDTVGARVTDVIRMAESRNPSLVTIVLTSHVEDDMADFEHEFASLHAVMGSEVAPVMLSKMALSWAVQGALMPKSSVEPMRVKREDDAPTPVFSTARRPEQLTDEPLAARVAA